MTRILGWQLTLLLCEEKWILPSHSSVSCLKEQIKRAILPGEASRALNELGVRLQIEGDRIKVHAAHRRRLGLLFSRGSFFFDGRIVSGGQYSVIRGSYRASLLSRILSLSGFNFIFIFVAAAMASVFSELYGFAVDGGGGEDRASAILGGLKGVAYGAVFLCVVYWGSRLHFHFERERRNDILTLLKDLAASS